MWTHSLTPPPRPRVLLVHKRTLYESHIEHAQDLHMSALIEAGDISVKNVIATHERHSRSLEQTIEAFERHSDLSLEVWGRERLAELDGAPLDFDLIVVVGGDGTVLETSHSVTNRPLLGVNSDPSSSVGFLCTGKASDTHQLADAYLDGRLRQRPLTRMSVAINQKLVGTPVLNDVLFAHSCPAATSRYLIGFDGAQESQKSSGLWISTAAGSTAAIRSAGGLSMDLKDQRIQFRVREPYMHPGSTYKSIAGWIQPGEQLEIISKMETAGIYLDGPHTHFPVTRGDRLAFFVAEHPLCQVDPRATEPHS